MCGFVGFLNNFDSNFNNNKNIIKNMNNLINYRGPDDEGYWNDENHIIFIGHKRLSIVDLTPTGSQPMHSDNKQFTIVFNGEIYNHIEIRNLLTNSSNINFKGSSDTETLLEAFALWGIDDTLKKIKGMFSFAIWDNFNKILYLARDRAGEKPLYYTEIQKGNLSSFVFGSELKIFNAYPNFNKNINLEAVNYQQLYKYIPSPYSIYNNVYKLVPGSYIKYEFYGMKKTIIKYWTYDEVIYRSKKKIINNDNLAIQNKLKNKLTKSIKGQLLGDVEIGAFLSGGIDSSLVVSIMQEHSLSKIKTFTIGFTDDEFNEAKNAKNISKYLKTNHHELYLDSSKLLDTIPYISNIYDEPFSDSSQIPTYLISKFASKHVKVCLSGDGGDELFGGYNRYIVTKKIWQYVRLLPYHVRLIISKMILIISPTKWGVIMKWCESFLLKNNKFVHYGDKMHKGAECLIAKDLNELYFALISDKKNNINDVLMNFSFKHMQISKYKYGDLNSIEMLMRNDFINYLPNDILTKVDRAAMANSLETRMPYLDKDLIDLVWQIPLASKIQNNNSKYLLKNILNEYIPSELIEQTKKGFSIPLAYWLRHDLRDWVESCLTKHKIEKYDIFNYKVVRECWNNHISEKFNNHAQIWNIIMMQSWLENNI